MSADAKVEPLALAARDAAKLLGIGRTTFYRLHSSGRVPLPVRLGGSVRWYKPELQEWLAEGAPSRAKWEELKKSRKRS